MLKFLFLVTLIVGWNQLIFSQPSKLALVVGNAEYDYLSSLNNSTNDARDISDALQEIGFDVDLHLNASKEELKEAIKDFGSKAKTYDIILFYYAGHGIELLGKNFFVPTDAYANTANEIKKTCLAASAVTHYMNLAKARTNIIIMDACRENPFTRLPENQSSQGLALMDAPTGTIISFATAPGNVASDGTGKNGVFTSALLTHLQAYDLDIKEMFERIRKTVVANTNGKQIPWESTSLTEGIILRRKPELPIQVNIVEGDSVVFEGNGQLHATSNIKDVSFHWYRNGRQFSNLISPRVNKKGNYQVKAISPEGQILLSAPIAVTIKSIVDPKPYIVEGNEITFKEGGTLHGKSNVKGKYTWKKDNNLVGEGTKIKVDIPGFYSFEVKTSEGVIATSASINVRIK